MKSKIILLSAFMGLCFATSVFGEEEIKVCVNDTYLNCDTPPQIVENRTLVPLRAVFEALGAKVEWNGEEKSISASKENTAVRLVIDDNKMIVNDNDVELDVAAQIIDGRTMVPIRAVSEAFDCEVEWDSDTKTVIVTDNKEENTETSTEATTATTTEKVTETTELSTETTTEETTLAPWIDSFLTYSEKPKKIDNISNQKQLMTLRSFVFEDFENNLENDFDSKALQKIASNIGGKRKDKVNEYVKMCWIRHVLDHVVEYDAYRKNAAHVVTKSEDTYRDSVSYTQAYVGNGENPFKKVYNLVDLFFSTDGSNYKRDIKEISDYIYGFSHNVQLDFDDNISYYSTTIDDKYALLFSMTDTDESTENLCSYMLIVFDKDGKADYFRFVGDGNGKYSLTMNGKVEKSDMENDLQAFLVEVEKLI